MEAASFRVPRRGLFVAALAVGAGVLLSSSSAYSQCNYPSWTQNASYAVGAIVRYVPNNQLYQATHANPVPPDTLAYNPTISTFFWSPFTCTSSTPTPTTVARPRPTATTAPSCNFPNWTQNASYAVGAIVRYAPNGLFYIATHANPVAPDTLAYDPTVSTFFWSPYTCSGGGATPTATARARSTPTATSAPAGNGSNWKGRTWRISSGAMAGVIPANPSNVWVDASGFLHLRIMNSGGWTGAETFTTGLLGFGTYQWQIQGNVDNLDKSTVLGLFPYGPAAGIGVGGENEIDIEFSKWNNTCACNADFAFWPNTGNGGLGRSAADLFTVNLNGGNLVTARFVWRSNSIVGTIMSGLQPVGTTANVLRSFTYAPSDFTRRIPQQAMPLGMNLWSYQVAPASNQEVIIRDFSYTP